MSTSHLIWWSCPQTWRTSSAVRVCCDGKKIHRTQQRARMCYRLPAIHRAPMVLAANAVVSGRANGNERKCKNGAARASLQSLVRMTSSHKAITYLHFEPRRSLRYLHFASRSLRLSRFTPRVSNAVFSGRACRTGSRCRPSLRALRCNTGLDWLAFAHLLSGFILPSRNGTHFATCRSRPHHFACSTYFARV
jgi:hypothetical protein